MLRCAGKIAKYGRCRNKAVYRQNPYIELCADCWYKKAHELFEKWHEWFLSDRKESEPTLWVFNKDKVIK